MDFTLVRNRVVHNESFCLVPYTDTEGLKLLPHMVQPIANPVHLCPDV